jgi:hypothetical protein
VAAHGERRAPPAEHRPGRRHCSAGRGVGRRPRRAGQHPVLRLGPAQPRRAAAQQGAAGAGGDGGPGRARATGGPDGRPLRPARLLQPVPEALHGRLGRPTADRGTQRRRPALPRRAGAAPSPGQRPAELPVLDLDGVAAVPELPGDGLDAGPVPELRPPRDRLRWVPMPGVPAHRRRRPDRSGMSSVPGPRAGGAGGARGQPHWARPARHRHAGRAGTPPARPAGCAGTCRVGDEDLGVPWGDVD